MTYATKQWGWVPCLMLCGAVSAADDAALAQCAGVDNPTARLACYDAVAGRPAQTGAATPGAAVPSPPPGAVVTVPTANPDAFGKQNVVDKLTARIVGKFTEWQYGTEFKLDNGQTWKSVEERSAVYPNVPENPEVEITRGIFGYRMEIKAIGRRLAVKRVS